MTTPPRKALAGRDWLIALALFVGVTTVTALAQTRQGVHRDESVYIEAGDKYAAWLAGAATGKIKRPWSDAAVAPVWSCGAGCNSEHPPLMKMLYGLAQRELTFLKPITAARLPTALSFGVLVALVFLFVVEAFGTRVGALAAALLTAAQPRAFFHAQTAAFDLPAAMFWFACVYVYWRALASERPLCAALGLGVLYGLFLATKLQSFFLPLCLGAHWLWLLLMARRAGRAAPRPWPLFGMVTVGPALFWVLWPYLWHHPIAHFRTYWGFHATHVHYNFEYLGTNYNRPPFPWHEPLGMLVTTAPVVLLALAAAGIAVLARSRRPARASDADPRATRALLLLAALVPVAPFFTGRTPIFGETKHWLATMPILAIAAGIAVAALAAGAAAEWRLGEKPRRSISVAAVFVLSAVAPAVVETVRSHPYSLSHYNALAGGAPGGADLGMNRQFWGYSPQGLFPWFNRTLPQNAKIYPHDWANMAFAYQQRDGRLRKDLSATGKEDPGIASADLALVVHELHFNKYDYMIWNQYRTVQPVQVLTLDGVPLVSVYQRRPPDPLAPAAPERAP